MMDWAESIVPDPLWRSRITGMVIGALISLTTGAVTWWAGQPEPPWFEFQELTAEYDPRTRTIELRGHYNVKRPCPEPERNMVLRREIINREYDVATIAARGDEFATEIGPHAYQDRIQLRVPLEPAGWSIRVMALCSGWLLPVVSPDATVSIRRRQ